MCFRACLPVRSFIALTLAALGAFTQSAVADDAADRQAIATAAQQWARAFNARDAGALAALVTDDILILDGSSRHIDGPALATQTWLAAAALTQGEIKAGEREIVITGDTAWRVGAIAYQRADGPWHKAQTLEIWKRTGSGWKLHRQMSSHLIAHTLRAPPSEPTLGAPTN